MMWARSRGEGKAQGSPERRECSLYDTLRCITRYVRLRFLERAYCSLACRPVPWIAKNHQSAAPSKGALRRCLMFWGHSRLALTNAEHMYIKKGRSLSVARDTPHFSRLGYWRRPPSFLVMEMADLSS